MDSLKTKSIKEYLSNVDFKGGNWSVHKMESDMKKLLGEVPGIDVQYKKDVMINELTSEAKEVKKLNKISIIYTDLDNQFKKIEIIL